MTDKSIPILPQVVNLTMVRQPNRVTAAKYNYSLIQQKVLFYIIKSLQDPINQLLKDKNKTFNQLELFKQDHVLINIPLKEISKTPSEYKELIETIKQLRKIDVTFPKKDKDGVQGTFVTGLITEAFIPEQKYKSEVKISVNREVAGYLVSLDGGFTKYAFEIAFNAKCKYTPRIYQLVCRWADVGGYTMPINEFRDWLVLGDKYQDYRDLRRNVLLPAYKELHKGSHVWFEFDKVMDGKSVSHIKFKIVTNEEAKHLEKLKDSCINMMKMHLGMTKDHIDQLLPLINDLNNVSALQSKLVELHSYINKSQVENIPAYALKALKNHFKLKD
jgi:hypothetical protein